MAVLYFFCQELHFNALVESQPRTQGICSWGAKYPGMVWSRDPRILRKMASCLLGLGGEYILSQLNMINLIALII
jgi:hypothetical protein